jgi:hypothetical protein
MNKAEQGFYGEADKVILLRFGVKSLSSFRICIKCSEFSTGDDKVENEKVLVLCRYLATW